MVKGRRRRRITAAVRTIRLRHRKMITAAVTMMMMCRRRIIDGIGGLCNSISRMVGSNLLFWLLLAPTSRCAKMKMLVFQPDYPDGFKRSAADCNMDDHCFAAKVSFFFPGFRINAASVEVTLGFRIDYFVNFNVMFGTSSSVHISLLYCSVHWCAYFFFRFVGYYVLSMLGSGTI